MTEEEAHHPAEISIATLDAGFSSLVTGLPILGQSRGELVSANSGGLMALTIEQFSKHSDRRVSVV